MNSDITPQMVNEYFELNKKVGDLLARSLKNRPKNWEKRAKYVIREVLFVFKKFGVKFSPPSCCEAIEKLRKGQSLAEDFYEDILYFDLLCHIAATLGGIIRHVP